MLAAALPGDEARKEADWIEGLLRRALPGERLSRLRAVLERAARRWQRRGLPADVVARAALEAVAPARLTTHSVAGQTPASGLRPWLDAMPVPLLVCDAQSRILVCNQAFEGLLSEAALPVVGRMASEFLELEGGGEIQPRAGDGVAPGPFVLEHVALKAAPGVQYLGSWIPCNVPGNPGGWLLRLAQEQPGMVEMLGERLRHEESRKERFAALLTVSNAVVTSLELDRTLETIAREARRVVQVDECTVFLLDEAENVLVPAACDVQSYRDEVMALRLPVGQGVTGHVAQTGQGVIVNDALNDPHAIQVPGTPIEQAALMSVPLLVRDRVAGVITLTRMGEGTFRDEDLELVTLFASQCSVAISNARLYEEVRRAYDELRETQSQLVQSAKLNALGEMAGGVAHNFNNILAAILGRTQLLLQSADLDDEQRRQLAVIEQAALDGAHAVRRVQEFTRLRPDERFEVLDVREVLSGILELTRPAWEGESKRRGIPIATALDLCAAQRIAGNASELREVFTNLVLNALDAMPWGGTLTLASADVGEEVCIRVTDTGVGMDAATLERIFDPFFTTKPVQGTGLGLSVAYGIIARHRGRISVESEPGRGSTFSVWLPVARSEPAANTPPTPGPLPRLRILVVDDEEPVLRVMADQLGVLGQQVETALGGAAGIERFAPGRFDALFTDLGMPEVNGWDLIRAVTAREPDLPVVIVTGWGAQIEDQDLRTRGGRFVIPKPFSIEDVRDTLRQIASLAARAA